MKNKKSIKPKVSVFRDFALCAQSDEEIEAVLQEERKQNDK